MTDTTRAPLTGGQITVLTTAGVLMLGTGAAGAWGTFTNIVAEFGRAATAAGMVAAGEGATLVLALVMVGVTLLGQSAPAPVRAGLWLAPLVASAVGLALADDVTEAVIYGVSPMGMCVAAEGLGFLARRVVVYRTGVDAEAQRRNAEAVQRLAYHRARAAGHPDEKIRDRSEKAAWKLARKVGTGDAELGARLVAVQRERLTESADAALMDMFGAAREVSAPADDEHQDDAAVTVERADEPAAEVDAEVNNEVTPGPRRELAPAPAEPLVICGEHEVFTPAVPPREVDAEVNREVDAPAGRLSADEAMNCIRAAWVTGKPVTEAAELSTRSRSYVHKVYARLDEEQQERRDKERAEDDAWMQQLDADRSGAVMS